MSPEIDLVLIEMIMMMSTFPLKMNSSPQVSQSLFTMALLQGCSLLQAKAL